MGIRQSLALVAATVAALLALPGVAAASAAPAVGEPPAPSGSIEVTLTVDDGPLAGVSGDLVVEITCDDAEATALTSVVALDDATTATTTITAVPTGVECVVSSTDLPLPPTGYGWVTDSAADTALVTVDAVTDRAEAALTLTLAPLDGDLAIALGILGAPAGGVTLDDEYTIVCGAVVQTRTISLTEARSGFVSVTGLPEGESCTVSPTGAPAAPSTFAWSDLSVAPATVTVEAGTTPIVEVRRTLAPVTIESATVQVTMYGAPATGLTGPMTIGFQCDSGDYLAIVTFTRSATGTATVGGIPSESECMVRVQALPPLPAGYAWFGASPIEAAMLTVGPGTSVDLFARLTKVITDPPAPTTPSTPSTSSGSLPISTTPSSGTPGGTTAPAALPNTGFVPIEAPTLALPDDPAPQVIDDDTVAAVATPLAAIVVVVGLALVLLGLIVGIVSMVIVARHRRTQLAYA